MKLNKRDIDNTNFQLYGPSVRDDISQIRVMAQKPTFLRDPYPWYLKLSYKGSQKFVFVECSSHGEIKDSHSVLERT